jgi:hypothetical protein
MDKKALIKALRDTVQSASNTVASNVSAPVDLIAAGLRKVGMPIPQAPVGGSQWMENMGLTIPVEDGIPKMAGDFLGMTVPIIAAAKAPQIASAANKGLENLAMPRTLNTPGYGGQRGAIVWHGSPNKFDAFDASKIGTGEGAQAYGHGMYFAESPDVAKGYRDLLTKSDKQFYIKGKRVEPELLDSFQSNVLNAKGYGRNKQDYLDELEMNRVSSGAIQKISKIWDEMGDVNVKEVLPENASLYKVDLPDETIARMLDWDKPLSQQAPDVQKAIKKSQFYKDALARYKETKQWYDDPKQKTGQSLHQYMQSGFGDEVGKGMTPEAAAAYLRAQGIPGIRYLDAGSRATGGTSNFVVFPGEERLLRILERNNQPMGLMGVK